MGLDIYFEKIGKKRQAEYKKECEEYDEKYRELNKEVERLETEEGKTEEEIMAMFESGELKYPEDVQDGPVEVGYFRKVNFLMEFFGYYDNCEYQEISKGEIEELVDRCREVAAIQPVKVVCEKVKDWRGEEMDRETKYYSDEDLEKAAELLPTQSGFFFGSTDYNEWYFEDVKEVLTWALGIQDSFDWENDLLLMYCWW